MDAIEQITQSLASSDSAQIFREKLSAQTSGFAEGLFETAQTGSQIGTDFSNTLFDMVKEHNANNDTGITPTATYTPLSISRTGAPTPGDLLGDFVEAVDAKRQVSDAEKQKLLTGKADNIHQSMIAIQEAGVAFNLMVEIRNKLIESYQELMRTQV